MTGPGGRARFARLDAVRGAAVVWMVAYHFAFDLDHFGWIRQDFHGSPGWTLQRAAIVTLFLGCLGMGQAIAGHRRQGFPAFARRWLQIALCAVAVSLGSARIFPDSWISFGVLHCIAAALLVLRATRGAGTARWGLGAVALIAPLLWQHPVFDSRWTDWVGLVTHKPLTEDFVPLMPWLGVAWWGAAAGDWILSHRPGWFESHRSPGRELGTASSPGRSADPPTAVRARGFRASPASLTVDRLAALGRWSLPIYMLHQPLLFGVLEAIGARR